MSDQTTKDAELTPSQLAVELKERGFTYLGWANGWAEGEDPRTDPDDWGPGVSSHDFTRCVACIASYKQREYYLVDSSG